MKQFFLLFCLFWVVLASSCKSNTGLGAIKLSPAIFKDSITSSNAQVIDVRTLEEFRKGHIDNAIHIDYYSGKFVDSIKLLNVKQPVYLYCRSGKRSAKSVSFFKAAGFENVYDLEGGFLKWEKAGL